MNLEISRTLGAASSTCPLSLRRCFRVAGIRVAGVMHIVGVIGGRLSTCFAAIWMRLRSVEVFWSSFAMLNPVMSGRVLTRDPEHTSQLPDVDDGFGPTYFALLAHVLLQYACVLPPSECFGR